MQIDPRLWGDEEQQVEDSGQESTDSDEERQLGYNPQVSKEYAQYDDKLAHDRKVKKQNLQHRFEHIFEKYGKDFEGVGDEIDLETGLIVVDNGPSPGYGA